MSAPRAGDLVVYEGARWRVVAERTASLQRFGNEFKPVGEPCLVLGPDPEPDAAGERPDVTVPRSRWDEVEVVRKPE